MLSRLMKISTAEYALHGCPCGSSIVLDGAELITVKIDLDLGGRLLM